MPPWLSFTSDGYRASPLFQTREMGLRELGDGLMPGFRRMSGDQKTFGR